MGIELETQKHYPLDHHNIASIQCFAFFPFQNICKWYTCLSQFKETFIEDIAARAVWRNAKKWRLCLKIVYTKHELPRNTLRFQSNIEARKGRLRFEIGLTHSSHITHWLFFDCKHASHADTTWRQFEKNQLQLLRHYNF